MNRRTQVIVRTTDERSVELSGAVIAVAGRAQVAFAGGDLWFHLQVWQTDGDNGFVPAIRAFLNDESDPLFVDAESVNSSTDVENFFFAFDPSEMVHNLIARSFSRESADRRVEGASAAYEKQVSKVLRQFHDAVRQHQESQLKKAAYR